MLFFPYQFCLPWPAFFAVVAFRFCIFCVEGMYVCVNDLSAFSCVFPFSVCFHSQSPYVLDTRVSQRFPTPLQAAFVPPLIPSSCCVFPCVCFLAHTFVAFKWSFKGGRLPPQEYHPEHLVTPDWATPFPNYREEGAWAVDRNTRKAYFFGGEGAVNSTVLVLIICS